MGATIYKDHDQAALDWEYNLRARFPDFLEAFERWSARSIRVRASRPARLNLAYGPSGGQRLDVFPGDGAEGPAPVHVFIHGGYWRSLDAKDFSYVVEGLAPRGVTTVIPDYDLAPHAAIPEIVEQMRAMLAWLHGNIAAHGGDPARITVSGHSAGGHLAAMMMATDWTERGLPRDLVKAGCGISGVYELEPIRLSYMNAEFDLDPDAVARASPTRLARAAPGPMALAVGSREGAEFQSQSADFAAAWGLDAPEILAGCDHFTIIDGLGDPDAPLTQTLHRLIGV